MDRGRLRRIGSVRGLLEGSSRLELTVRGAAPAWLEAMRQQGAEVSERDGLHRVVVDRAAHRPAIERLWQEGGELLSLVPVRSTVEDFFLEAVEDAAPLGGGSE